MEMDVKHRAAPLITLLRPKRSRRGGHCGGDELSSVDNTTPSRIVYYWSTALDRNVDAIRYFADGRHEAASGSRFHNPLHPSARESVCFEGGPRGARQTSGRRDTPL